jgi:ABC-type glycerol-3-phosphate transport system substrate-binding protein
MFYAGKAAMFFAGSWVPQGIATDAPPEFANSYKYLQDAGLGARQTPLDGQPGRRGAGSLCQGHVPEAIKFLKFLYEPERYSRTMNATLSMPSTAAAAERVDNPIMKEMTSWLPDGAPHILFGKGSWDAATFVHTPELRPLQPAIFALVGRYSTNWPALAAGLTISILPIVVVYVFMQKQFVAGLTAGAVKG